ncbi:MAG: hypothetical protein AAB912_02400 [Patescibacteria group bacterium]
MSYRWQFLEKKEKARQLRSDGFSIKAIERQLGIARSTASSWCRDVVLTQKQLKKLYWSARAGAWRGSLIAAEQKKRAKREREEKISVQAIKSAGKFSRRDLFMVGIGLYAGEGSKTGNTVQFSNTNPELVKLMMEWFRKCCKVPEQKLRGFVYIHDDCDEKKAQKFWSHLTRIPLLRFTKSYIAKKRGGSFRKQLHPYGVFRVTISNTALLCTIKTWIHFVGSNIPG